MPYTRARSPRRKPFDVLAQSAILVPQYAVPASALHIPHRHPRIPNRSSSRIHGQLLEIAFFVPYTPTRIRTRSFHFLKTLSQNGHALTLFTVWTDAHEREALLELEALGIRVIATRLTRVRSLANSVGALTQPLPMQALYAWKPALAKRWTDCVRASAFDVVHVEHLRGAKYGLALKQARTGATPAIVWDSVDCISSLFSNASTRTTSASKKFIARIELPRTRTFEAAMLRALDETIVVSEAERQALLALLAQNTREADTRAARLHVVPNGVDTDYFTRRTQAREPHTLVFSGKLSYHANITAAHYLLDEIMPRVWAQQPEVRLMLVGANPSRSLVQRAAQQGSRVVVTGTVPDVRPYLERATLAVAPIVYGAGMQNKVLEAMAMGAPLIASPLAVAALAVQPDRDVIVAADSQTFADKIVQSLSQPALLAALAAHGRQLVESDYSWRSSIEKLESIYWTARQNAICLNP